MYSSIDPKSGSSANERNKFLMGSLYALGGLLKVEAKSYLLTENESETKEKDWRLSCILSNPDSILDEQEKTHLRKLSDEDRTYFKEEFYLVMK